MTPSLKSQRLGAVASVVTSLVIASGCRSASVNSGTVSSPIPSSIGMPPFYRSYERSTPSAPAAPPYEDSYQSPSPQPVPPSVLPVPGASEQEVPPPPSAQKSKWNMLPSGFKFPSLGRQANQVNQTGAKSSDQGYAATPNKRNSYAPTLREQSEVQQEEIVLPRTVTSKSNSKLAPPTSSESDSWDAPLTPSTGNVESVSNQDPIILPQLKTPINSRYGVIRQWPGKAVARSQSDANVTNDSNSAPLATDETPSTQVSDAPLLLPPSQ